MARLSRFIPISNWAPGYRRSDLRSDMGAGITVAAMLVPQAMAYALLAGLPPEVGLYAATLPVLAYAVFGTSRQLAVGPVAIVSLLTATALAPLADEGTAAYLGAAALLALMVGVLHLVLGFGRLGFIVNFLSHSVLVGFTAAAAIVIGLSQVKHLLGVSIPRGDSVADTVLELGRALDEVNSTSLALGLTSVVVLLVLKRYWRAVPGALVVVVASTAVVALFDLEARGVATVGQIPGALPTFVMPELEGGLVRSLMATAAIITLVGFMESVAVAKVYARRNRYDIDPNQELIGLGMSNVSAGLFGGYPVTGGFSRTAVNASAGARTPLASIVTAVLVVITLAVLTPLFNSLPQAALAAIIVVAVANLVDINEMRHIAVVKRSDLVTLSVAFFGTLILGIEIGIAVAVVASMLVVFARMSTPHTAVLGRISRTTSYRNIDRFPEAQIVPGIRVLRIDAAMSFVNASFVKRLLLDEASAIEAPHELGRQQPTLVVDFSGINDIDATGAATLEEAIDELTARGVDLRLSDVKGPVRDVLRRAHLWDRLAGRIHATTHDAVVAAQGITLASHSLRLAGIDERDTGTTDSGTTDSGTTDSGTTDSGLTDSGTVDSSYPQGYTDTTSASHRQASIPLPEASQ
jgi:sulfate permease, SulP family